MTDNKTTITYISLSAVTTLAVGLFLGWMIFQPNETLLSQESTPSSSTNQSIDGGENGSPVQVIQSCMFVKGETPKEIAENADAILSSEATEKIESTLTRNQPLGTPTEICIAKNSEVLLMYPARTISNKEEGADGLLAIPVPVGDPTITLVLSDSANNDHRVAITALPSGTTCQISHEGYVGPKHVFLQCETSHVGYFGIQLFDWDLSTDSLSPLRRCARSFTFNQETDEFTTLQESCKEDAFSFAPFVTPTP